MGTLNAEQRERRRIRNRLCCAAWRRRNRHLLTGQHEPERREERAGKLRCYNPDCRRPATQQIERVNPATWKTEMKPYCGFC